MDIADELEEVIQNVNATKIKSKSSPWVEKHRPNTVEEISHQDEVVQTLKKSIELGSIPHLLFHGPPGTGLVSKLC